MEPDPIDTTGLELKNELLIHTVQSLKCPVCNQLTLTSTRDDWNMDEYYVSCTGKYCWYFATWEKFKTTLNT